MKKTLTLFSACVLSTLILASAVKDGDWLTAILSKLEAYNKNYPQEKVHLQLDKPYYSIGDDIWFKAYVVNSESNELSVLSKVLYVDLVDEKDSVRKTLTLPIANGLTNGDFTLTAAMVDAGNYHIRAYTRWMQNFDSDFIFSKDIKIGDARMATNIVADAVFSFAQPSKLNAVVTYINVGDKSPVVNKTVEYTLLLKNRTLASGKAVTDNLGKVNLNISLKEQLKADKIYLETNITPAGKSIKRTFAVHSPAGKLDVQFFPEGGRMVEGLRTRVAFKAVQPDGSGANVHGRIVDQANNKIADIKSAHAGMGVFAIQPLAGSTYTALITDEAGVESKYALPAPTAEGYVLNVNQTGKDSVTIRVAASKAFVSGREFALVAQQNGVVRYSSKFKLDKSTISTQVSKKRFGTGIVQFTLLSADALPLAERLLFINHHDQLQLDISTNRKTFGKREKVEMQLLAKDEEGVQVQGNFSVAVTDADMVKIDEDDETTIYSNFLLASDLKGHIESPNYYFTGESEAKARDLDYLLLTQGWRRFSWADVKYNTSPVVKLKPQTSIELTGNITTLSSKPVPGGKVTLYAYTTDGILLQDTVADDKGNFIFTDLKFGGDVKFVVKAKNARDKDNVIVTLNERPLPKFKLFYVKDGETFTTSVINYLQNTQKRFGQMDNLANTIMLDEVKVNDRKVLRIDKDVIEGSYKLGTGAADLIIRKERLIAYNSLIQAFYGQPGIFVKREADGTNVVYRVGRRSSITQPERVPMMVMLNGTSINPKSVQDIFPGDVEAIEVLKSDYNLAVYGDDGAWGVINITLKNGRSGFTSPPSPSISRVTVNGYAVQREFYSPVYNNEATKNKGADLRSTIYWNPNLVTGTDGKANATYYTADQPGTYRAIAEGIDIDGRLARQVFTFTVK